MWAIYVDAAELFAGRRIRPLIDRVYLDIDSGLIGGIDRRRRLRSSSSTSTPSLRFPRLPSEQEDDDECNDKGCPEDELWIREEASRRMRLAVLPHVDPELNQERSEHGAGADSHDRFRNGQQLAAG